MTWWGNTIAVRRRAVVLKVGSLCLLVAGCGREAMRRVMLEGQVSFNGEPIADGTISLLPLGDTPGPPVTGIIQDGNYTISEAHGPTIGRYRVDIEGYRKTGRQVPDMASPLRPGQPRGMIEEKVPYIPQQFNVSSTLTTEITTDTRELNINLSS